MGLGKALNGLMHWLKLLPNALTLYCAITLLVVTVAALFSGYNRACELLSHLVLLYVFMLVLLSLLALTMRARAALAVAVVALILNLALLVPDLVPPQSRPGDRIDKKSGERIAEKIRLIEFNCWGPKNKKPAEIHTIAEEEKAAIVCFCEVEGGRKKSIEHDFSDYPYKALFPFNCGLGLVSKLPIVESRVLIAEFRMRPRMLATVQLKDGRKLAILIVHPTIPVYKNVFDARNKEFHLYASDLANISAPKMIVGDLNCTPWSSYFQQLLHNTGLIDSEKGFGAQASWPTHFKLIPFLPIDHCLVSPDIVVTGRKIEREAGSDHRPVLIEFMVP